MSEEKNAAHPHTLPEHLTQSDRENHASFDDRIIDLHLQEYIALRAEQRTRLDSANKIIHYYAIMLAAVVVGLVTVYKNGGYEAFNSVFPLVLLSIPIVTIPFVFAQQNEEIIVRNIGDYFCRIKAQISPETDKEYWTWEEYHFTNLTNVRISKSFPFLHITPLQITAIFRAGLLIFFSMMSLAVYYFNYGASWPWTFLWHVYQHWSDSGHTFYMGALLCIDWILILAASLIGMGMIHARVPLQKIVSTLRLWPKRKQTNPPEKAKGESKAE